MWWSQLISGLFSVISAPLKEWQVRKTKKIEHQAKIMELEIEERVSISQAKVELAKQGMVIESDWDARAQESQKNSWKDEFVLIIFSLPFILSFVPAYIATVQVVNNNKDVKYIGEAIRESWLNVSLAPDWYQWLLIGIVSGIYGLRWMVGFIKPKKNKIVDSFKINEKQESKKL